ncbi:MAG: rhomboid family intramembrane serine protease [Bacteroidetes bacterium]|nr:rhomboid family intramembrane serine protease [Bacteroidota bacterium]
MNRFYIPPVIKVLLAINVVFFLAQVSLQESFPGLTDWGALHHWSSPRFKPHQVITHMFLHGGFMHILFNMLALWMFGSTLESYWGAKRFLNFYLICGIGAAVVQMLMVPWEIKRELISLNPGVPVEVMGDAIQEGINNYSMIGASGAIMGIAAAFAYLFPNTEFYMMFFPMPIKAKYLIPIYVLIDLFGGFSRRAGDNVGHFAHLGGALVGIIIVIIMNRNNRRNFY